MGTLVGAGSRRRPGAGESGQSTLEFALMAAFFVPFVLYYIQVALVMGFANYAHYAVFMSARAYLSAGDTTADQGQRAQDVITLTLKRGSSADRFPSLATAMGGGGPVSGMTTVEPADGDYPNAWQQGVRYAFRSKIFMIPLMGSGTGKNQSQIQLTAESYLLREPSEEECQSDMAGRNNGIFDNGC